MRFFVGSVAFTALLVCACSSISKRQTLISFPFPPFKLEDSEGRDPVSIDHLLERKLRETPTDPVRNLVRYKQAQLWTPTDPGKACTLWLEVATHPRFPLNHLARLHAMETCPTDRGGFPSLDEVMTSTTEPWLKEKLIEASLRRARRVGDKAWEMRLSADSAEYARLQSEKVGSLNRAIELAQELKDDGALAKFQERLREIAPRFVDDPPPEQLLKVARDFRSAREFDKARAFYRRALQAKELTDTEKLQALDGIRMSYKIDRRMNEYLEATKEYAAFAREKFYLESKKKGLPRASAMALLERYFNTQVILARAVWTENSPREAEKILRRVEREVGNSIDVSESIWVRARIHEEAGRFKEAVRLLAKINTAKLRDPGLKQKILWYKAWNLRKTGRLKQAIAVFDELIPIEDSPTLIARDRFWLAKTLKSLGQAERAHGEFEWLIEHDPMGYYGLVSYRELDRKLAPLSLPEVRLPARVPETPPSEIEFDQERNALDPESRMVAEWLISVGENEIGRRFLDHASADRRAGYNEDQSIDLLTLYARTGSYQALFSRLYDLPAPVRTRIVESRPELLFPQPWRQHVKATQERFGVEPELIYSIMRQESAFNPLARSHADAFGLMQLLPQAAQRAQESSGVVVSTHEDLYMPEKNIVLGGAFLRGLLDRWQGQFVLAVASYNASERAIHGWMKTRFRGEPLEFIEDVPYDETRGYIKLVMRNYIFYSRLNSNGEPIAFPQRCLDSLHDIKL